MADLHESDGDCDATAAEPTMTALVSGILRDAQALMRQEVQLARIEIKEELNKTKDAAISFAVGAALTAGGAAFLVFAVVFLLAWATGWPLWSCFAIIGGVCVITGGSLLYFAKTRAEDIHLVPPQTAQTLQENMQWLKHRT